ncbi:MAG: peptidoglycan DD-metalloendopeptidase family protein [Myxococcota bacterium]
MNRRIRHGRSLRVRALQRIGDAGRRAGGANPGRRALVSAALLFVLSACVSYGLLRGGSPPDPLGARRVEVLDSPAADGPALPFGPVLPVSLERGVEPFAPEEPDSGTLQVRTGHIPRGGTLAIALRDQGVSPGLIDDIARAMRPLFDFRHAHAGDFFALVTANEGELLSFEYQRGRRTVYKLQRNGFGLLQATRTEAPLQRRVVQLSGVIEHSLFRAIKDLGEGGELAQAFADVFVWDFDFSSQTRPGDEFRMVVEKLYDRDGFVRYGKVLAASYRTPRKEFTALYFEDRDGYGDYYTPEGYSVRRTFLRAPVKYSRISSRYSKARLHPVLKVRRPHEGVDYAAPTGTPVWAVADGVVTFKGWSGGLGRLIKVRHGNGYTSYYGHLSRYGKGVRVGARVQQKQVIGYVGKSGLATGPHLDYRLRVRGRFVDPLKVRFPKGTPITVKARVRFEQLRDIRLAELREAQSPVVVEAAM